MALTLNQLKEMLRGFKSSGCKCLQQPALQRNPVNIEWLDIDGTLRKYRLWIYEITHGGGYRASNEYRIQITNAPQKSVGMDYDGAVDLVMGYSPNKDVIVAYDRRWLEKRMEKGDGSPSVQVKEADINAAISEGIHHLTKDVDFGTANIVTFRPDLFPEYLKNHTEVLSGNLGSVHMKTGTPPASVWHYCLEQGYYFPPDLLARYIAAISSKPFVILAGVSGTGKSKMAELVAEYYTAVSTAVATDATDSPQVTDKFAFSAIDSEIDRSRFALVPVRPDWIDNQSILGFINPITGNYESTQALDLILRALKAYETAPDKSDAPRYFMLLDEMNLARVEHYFSDWLACSESRRVGHDKKVIQQPITLHRHENATAIQIGSDNSADQVVIPSSLEIPTNLIVTGTVNVDETTFGFSPKVLDRSMVIEFNDVDLDGMRNGPQNISSHGYLFPTSIPPYEIPSSDVFRQLPLETHQLLVTINKILEKAQLHFGYRSANEISLFVNAYNKILPEDASDTAMLRAIDGAILQKILPRIQGNRARVEETLSELLYYFKNLSEAAQGQAGLELSKDDFAKLPKSYLRGFEMLERLRSFGFVTFFK